MDAGSFDWIGREEAMTISLRRIFESFGYKRARIDAFEDYDLFRENRSFLREGGVLAFNDAGGRLMALRPDVTLSVAKGAVASERETEKLYYLEDVYRTNELTRSYHRISQLGLECFGRGDAFLVREVLLLAALSLREIGGTNLMTLSHAGFVIQFMEGLGVPAAAKRELADCIRKKSPHGLRAAASRYAIGAASARALSAIAELYGEPSRVLDRARRLAASRRMEGALAEVEALCAFLGEVGFGENLRLDFSLMNDADYYSGILFQGFVEGSPRAVLTGGDYSGLMRRLGGDFDAVGFAIALNELRLPAPPKLDADALVLYGDAGDFARAVRSAEGLRAQGLRVRFERAMPEGFTCERAYRFEGGELKEAIPC